LEVVTEASSSTSTVMMTYPKAGSSEEMVDEHGAALANKCLAFKSGSDMSTLLIYRSIENEGGIPFVTAGREGAVLGYTVAPDKAVGLVPMLAVDCSFETWDVRDAKKLAETETEVASESAQVVLTENMYAAAYGPQSAAGKSFFYYDVSTDLVKSFRARGYGLNGAVLTATGIPDHAAFCAEVGELLADSPAGTPDAPSAISYIGGESRVYAPATGYAHVALAFEAPTSSVVGKVVKSVLSVLGSEAGLSGFSAPGLVGVYGGSDEPAGIVDAMTAVLTTSLTSSIVKRGKTLAKAEALLALDGGSKALAEAMTQSVLEAGSFSSPGDVAKAYDSVTDKQVTDAVKAMLAGSPSLATVGDIGMVPYLAAVASRLS
jgi:predicted Zn-dependent peptidase